MPSGLKLGELGSRLVIVPTPTETVEGRIAMEKAITIY